MPPPGSTEPPASAGKTYYLPKGLHPRVKAAWWATREQPTLGALVASLFTAESDRREREFNDGHPFPPAKAPVGPRGGHIDGESHSYYIPVAVHERFVAAWAGTQHTPAATASVSTLAAELLEAEAARLERELNDGQPFPPAPAGARGVDPQAARRQGELTAKLWKDRRART